MNNESFELKLRELKLQDVLNAEPFKKILPQGTEQFANKLYNAISSNKRIHIEPDCDPDGYLSALIIKTMFDTVGFSNYEVGKLSERRHTISKAYVSSVIDNGVEVFFAVDSSTNDWQLQSLTERMGAELFIIDHHEPSGDFEFCENRNIINPRIDCLTRDIPYKELSAGAICSLFADYFISRYFKKITPESIYLYGAITLYSDSCDFSNEYNRSFIKRFQNTTMIESPIIKLFWSDRYTFFDKSYISYKWVPRINSLIRMEQFDTVQSLFFENVWSEKEDILADVAECYTNSKKYVEELKPQCEITVGKHIVIAILPENGGAIARNFTGLVAINLATQYGLPVLCLSKTDAYHGSVRDPYNRDLLCIFSTLCRAAGHNSAFGVEIVKDDFKSICNTLLTTEILASVEKSSMIQINWNNLTTTDIIHDAKLMAEFNEFSCANLPIAVGLLTIDRSFKLVYNQKFTSIYGRGIEFTSFCPTIGYGDTMVVSPTMKGASQSLIVNYTLHTEGENNV